MRIVSKKPVGFVTEVSDYDEATGQVTETVEEELTDFQIIDINSGEPLEAELSYEDGKIIASVDGSPAEYEGPYNITENQTLATAGLKMKQDVVINVDSAKPQLHQVTGLSQSAGIATWSGDSYTEAYKLYLDSELIDTVTSALFDLVSLTVSIGQHTFGVAASATNFTDAVPATLSFAKRSITVNIVDGTYSGPSEMFSFDTAEIIITPNTGMNTVIINSVTNASYEFDDATNTLTLSNPTGNVTVDIECIFRADYIIGFRGAAQSTPALTRTDKAVGATITNNGGVLGINGIDMDKVWGGYIGNDEEELTWDSTSKKFLHNGVVYTGNVFSKINRFFTKASYVEVDGEQVLDGYQLCYENVAPDDSWQDWFLGKPYTKIGCYKARGADDWTNGLQSKQGLSGRYETNANNIATASSLNTSTTATMHMKWYNQNSILQVLFMTLFATRQTEDVFPRTTFRSATDTQNTGYLDEMRSASSCATGYSTAKTGNMFLGIEDFVGYGWECLGGVKLFHYTNVQTSLDYATFNFDKTYTQADIDVSNINSNNSISSLQESTSVPGLLLPKKSTGTNTTYYCDMMWIGGVPIYQGANTPHVSYGVFSLRAQENAKYSSIFIAARLCGEPL